MKISIITPAYNSAKTIRKTIESIRSQTYKEIEHIVVDGASSDETVRIASEYKTENMVILSEPDTGLYDAINKGMSLASGEIVGILNSDDFYPTDDVLQTVADAFVDKDIDAVYGDVYYVSQCEPFKKVRFYSSAYFRPWMMRLGFIPAHPSFYIRKSKAKEVGVYSVKYKIASDFEFLLRCFFKNKLKTNYIRKVFVYMREGGISNQGFKSHQVIFMEHRKALKENDVYSNPLLLAMRYPVKVYQLAVFKLKTLFCCI